MVKNIKDNPQNEFTEKLVIVKKVSKTVKGGKNFSFSALVVVGDKKGRVGYAKGNAREVIDARRKATEAAKKRLVRVPLKENRTIHHDVTVYSSSAKVHLRMAPMGTGVIAGGPMRAVFECLGISDIVTKSIGSSNPFNIVKATFEALDQLSSPRLIAERRSKDVSKIIEVRNKFTS
jgi:small subunit ribosomal protein S5